MEVLSVALQKLSNLWCSYVRSPSRHSQRARALVWGLLEVRCPPQSVTENWPSLNNLSERVCLHLLSTKDKTDRPKIRKWMLALPDTKPTNHKSAKTNVKGFILIHVLFVHTDQPFSSYSDVNWNKYEFLIDEDTHKRKRLFWLEALTEWRQTKFQILIEPPANE